VLAEPLATPTGASVILSTYFGGRIDPTHCWHYPGGRLPSNAFPVLKPWYEAVERLGLSAVVFHDDDALGSEYAAGSQTGQVLFQRVQLGRPGWSLGDERWEVYLKWMQSPAAANVRWVLHVDPLEAVLAHDPFTLIQGQMAQYQLWTHVQHATRHDATRFARCFRNLPGSERWSVDEGGEILDTSAVGGTKQVMIDLARSMVLDLEGMYYESKTDAWHCQAAVMSRLLALADGPLGGVRTFKGGYPFCGEMADCVHDGVCDHALYANQA